MRAMADVTLRSPDGETREVAEIRVPRLLRAGWQLTAPDADAPDPDPEPDTGETEEHSTDG